MQAIFTIFMRLYLFLCLSLVSLSVYQGKAAPYTFEYTSHCRQAYQHFMSLQLNEGRAAVMQEIKANPYNLMAIYLADYEDCLLLMLNGDRTDYEQRKHHFDERLDLLSKGSEKDPWYRLSKAGIYLHWAMVHIRFGDNNMKAALQFRKSFLLLKENKERFPAFDYNNIYLGVEQVIAGAMPDKYKWLASVFGIKGDVRKGTALVTSFVNSHSYQDPFKYEAALFACYLRFYFLYQQAEVWNFINSEQFPAHNNLLFSFIKANIALNGRKADAAIQAMKAAQTYPNYNFFPAMHYEMGSALFYKADPSCIGHLQTFVNKYKGRMFVKDAWQKMALISYLQRNMTQANAFRAKIKTQGSTIADIDLQAQRFSEHKDWPNSALLQAHLLIDGGYNQQALDKLLNYRESDFKEIPDKLEYNFRLARAYDELNEDNRAIQLYQEVINMGRYRKEHFAARSALQMALIYERAGKKQEAIKRFHECLAMRNHDFQGAIDQQAKAGLNRLGV